MTTAPIPKTKASDYLQEFANQSNEEWLRFLISKVFVLRTVPNEETLDEIYQKFLVEHKLKNSDAKEEKTVTRIALLHKDAKAKSFILKELQHEEGVNALERGVTIPFHQKLTVVYGKNGSGKSGFVRILKRLAGSRTQEEVWQNIHDFKTQNRCKAKVSYTSAGGDVIHQWNGESKTAPFDQMAVFDGRCIPIYLNKSLSFSYQPYGFELFQAISIALQGLQERLNADIQSAASKKPRIDDIFNEETSIGKFVIGITPTTKVEDLNKLPIWDSKTQKNLAERIKERKGLQNLDQQSELLRTRHQKLKALEDALIEAQSDLSAQGIGAYLGITKKFHQLKKKQTAKKGKTLEDYDITEMESDEWEKFIDAGEDYIRIAEHDNYPNDGDQCVYCQQKLSKGAQKLIQLYRELFQEEETSDIEDVEAKLNEALEGLRSTSYAENFPYSKDEYKKLLQKRTVEAAFATLKEADSLSRKLAQTLASKKPQKKPSPLRASGVITSMRKVRTKAAEDIKSLEETQRNLYKKSQELERIIDELEDIQKFSKRRSEIEKYVSIERWVAKALSVLGSKLNTKPITDLGKRAWRELVSDSFKARFHQEATDLEAPSVNLDFRGEYGSQMRAKNVEGLEGSIDQFLSEGEQKAVALADFFAELSMQNEHAPVIFDDPATSFDHDRKERIAKRIAKESETRQIIVFTHDLMFASYLHQEAENSNNSEIDVSKASFHNLQAQANKIGVVTTNYYPGSTKFNAVIEKVESRIPNIETLSGEQQMDAIKNAYDLLRGAIEKAVEERIFGGVIKRWSEQIQMRNVVKANLDKDKLTKAGELHDKFSGFINAHNQSDEMIQHSMPSIDTLKADIGQVKDIATRQA